MKDRVVAEQIAKESMEELYQAELDMLGKEISKFKPVTDEQVFYDKFSYDKFYLPSARVYMQHILYDKFSYDKFYFTGVNVSTSLL